MRKTRNLNGLPSNLAMSYLSTLGYYNGGYMADWLNFIARDKRIAEITIDILNSSIEPKEAEIKPLLVDMGKLRGIIKSELENNEFEVSFIRKAILKFEIPIDSPTIKNTVYCYPLLEDGNGKIYKPKSRIIETAYEVHFNPLQKLQLKTDKVSNTLIAKFKRLFK